MSKIHVFLAYGGQSSEHEVSLMSARNVYAALDNTKYNVTLCLIDKSGHWWLQDSIGDEHVGRPQLLPVLGQKRFITLPEHHIIQVDVILPILHGQYGEDGTVQGLAKLIGVPCAGPSLLGSAVTMDKDMTKRLLEHAGIPVVPWRTWRVSDAQPSYKEVSKILGKTIFVKPASAGSSVGVGKVQNDQGWAEVLQNAGKHSETVLIEKAIAAREIEVAVLGNDKPKITIAGEIAPGEEFYSYDDKYKVTSTASVIIPAEIPSSSMKKIQDYALKAYAITECRGMARVDFFIDPKGKIYLNEINTIPGFTNISMFPKLWRHSGLSYPKLLDRLIELALE